VQERPAGERLSGLRLARRLAWEALCQRLGSFRWEGLGARQLDQDGTLSVPYLGKPVVARAHDCSLRWVAGPLALLEEVLVVRYLAYAGPTNLAQSWLSFRDLPGGRGYFGPFSNRSTRILLRQFGQQPELFAATAESLGGEPLEYGDRSYSFALLPLLPVAIVLYVGDDEFGPEATVLFDRSALQLLTTEDCAVAAQVVCSRLVRAASATWDRSNGKRRGSEL